MTRFTWEVIPRRVAAGQLTHTCAEGQPEEQPAGQPEGHRVMIAVRRLTAQQTQRSYKHSQKPSLQQQRIPMRTDHTVKQNYKLRKVCGTWLVFKLLMHCGWHSGHHNSVVSVFRVILALCYVITRVLWMVVYRPSQKEANNKSLYSISYICFQMQVSFCPFNHQFC